MDGEKSPSEPKVNLGYACINNELAAAGIQVNRTARLATITAKGLEHIRALVRSNIADCVRIVLWNHRNGIRFYRMSSGMVSHVGNDRLDEPDHTVDHFRGELAELGRVAAEYSQRLSFHVGQYTLLSTSDEAILARSVADLRVHSEILDAIETVGDPGVRRGVIIMHGGGTYGNKVSALETIRRNVRGLSSEIRSRIVFENDERSYSPYDLLPVCEEFSLPFCLDVFHYKCYVGGMGGGADTAQSPLPGYSEMLEDDLLWDRVAATWTIRGLKMKIHVSSQKPGGPPGAHADFIDPTEIDFPRVLKQCRRVGADIMVEAKAKEAAVIKLRSESGHV